MNNKNISLKNISINISNKTLLIDTDLKISHGRKYGLIGHNGVGKSTLLRKIMNREFSIPLIDIFYVEQEVESSDISVYETILNTNVKIANLLLKEKKLDLIINNDDFDDDQDILDEYNDLISEMNNLNISKEEHIIRKLLYGLGFTMNMQQKPTKEFSGGWKMRISLAKGLYMKPTLLLLDEPTNHLDLNVLIWLTDYLSNQWKNTLVIISHDKNFLNTICTDIIHFEQQKLTYYIGNYDKFTEAYVQNTIAQEKEWKKVCNKVKEMRKKSTKKEIVDDYIKDNKKYEPLKEYKIDIYIKNPLYIKTPIINIKNISFGYDDKKIINDMSLLIDMETRMSIVGKNGIGKSTLLKLLCHDNIKPEQGEIIYDTRARIGYYNQHSNDTLELKSTPLEYLLKINTKLSEFEARRYLGSIGLEGKLHKTDIECLSGGQKARVVFASIFALEPHLILLDEPTNHLDIETIDGLIRCINEYQGGVIMISHNIDLLEKTNAILYEMDNGKLHKTTMKKYQDKVLNDINILI